MLVESLTKARMLAIEAASIVSGLVNGSGHLILTNFGGGTIDAGNVVGPQGPAGADGVDGEDGADASFVGVELGNAVNLNTITTPGFYNQSSSAEAAAGTNYPTGLAGLLEVFSNGGSMIWQRYTPHGVNAIYQYIRGYSSAAWGPWTRVGGALNAWPIGSIFMAVVSTNPNTLLGGGTWVAWGTGRMPIAIDTGQTEFDTVEETGGSKTHTLTTSNMPAHTHDITHDHANASMNFEYITNNTTSTGTHIRVTDIQNLTGGSGTDVSADINIPAHSGNSGSNGSGTAVTHLPPYIVCYMWKRTA